MNRIRYEAGVPGLRRRNLGHSHASHAVTNSVPVPVVSQPLGHADAGMTLNYAYVAEQDIKDAAQRAGKFIAAIMSHGGRETPVDPDLEPRQCPRRPIHRAGRHGMRSAAAQANRGSSRMVWSRYGCGFTDGPR